MKQTQSYVARDIHIINTTSLDRRGMAQKRTYVSQKLRCYMHKGSCNVTSRTTFRSDFPACSAVEAIQELHNVPGQVTYMIHTCVAGTPVEKL